MLQEDPWSISKFRQFGKQFMGEAEKFKLTNEQNFLF